MLTINAEWKKIQIKGEKYTVKSLRKWRNQPINDETRSKTMRKATVKTKMEQSPENDADPGPLSKDGVQCGIVNARIAL